MAVTLQQPTTSRYARIPAWLRELDFVTDGFTWLFRLMSRGAEALMTLSTIYIIIEAGVSGFGSPWLHNLAVAIMISAPEIILPGGFILASEIRAQGNRRWWLLSGMCWVFVILTGVTLADLFIWHLKGNAFAALMWGRCAAAVGYSILFRVITYRRETEVVPVAHVQATIEHLNEQLQRVEAGNTQRIELAVNQFTARLQGVQFEVVQQVQTLVQSLVSEQVQGVQSTISEQLTSQVADAVQGFTRELHTALAEVHPSKASHQPGSSPARSSRPAPAPRNITPLVQSKQASEPGKEPVNVRVPRFIQERLNQGRKPSLSEIEEQCQCSRNTAIRYRRELCGADEEERSA